MVNHFRQRIPAWADCEAIEFDFSTKEELLNNETIRKYLTAVDRKLEYCLNENRIMVQDLENPWWWVVGYITYPEKLDLPVWREIK